MMVLIRRPEIIIDENVDQVLLDRMDFNGYKVYSVRNQSPGMADKDILELAEEKNCAIVTEDKDFGDLVFAQGLKKCSVILLRYDKTLYRSMAKYLQEGLEVLQKAQHHIFMTIDRNGIRIRKV